MLDAKTPEVCMSKSLPPYKRVLANTYLDGWCVQRYDELSPPTSCGDGATGHAFVLSMDVDGGLSMPHCFEYYLASLYFRSLFIGNGFLL